MFPKLEFEITGMDPDQYYAIFLQIEQVDDHRYVYCLNSMPQPWRGNVLEAKVVALVLF